MIRSHSLTAAVLAAGFVCSSAFTRAAEKKAEPKSDAKSAEILIAKIKHPKPVDFEKEILPIFRSKCLACHNTSTAEEKLVLETPADILKGGDGGPAAKKGKGADSLLLKLAAHQKKPFMPPPKNKVGANDLTPDELGLVKQWIDEGAKGEVKGAGPIVWQTLPPGLNPIYSVALTSDGQFAAAGRANQIFIYHVPSTNLLTRLTDPKIGGIAHRDLVHSLAFSPDGTRLASGGYREVKLWQRPQNVQKAKLAAVAPKEVRLLTASTDGKWLASVGDDNAIKLWNPASPAKPVKTLVGHKGAVNGVKFSPDGTKLLTGSADKTARVWNVADGAQFAEIETPGEVAAVAWAAEGKQFASGGGDNLIRLWKLPDAAGGKVEPVKELKGHDKPVTALDTIAPAQLLSGGADGTVRQWDLEKGTVLRSMTQGTPVTAIAVRPDGKVFGSIGTTNLAKLWNAADGKLIADLKGDRFTQEAAADKERHLAFTVAEVTYLKASLKTTEDAQKVRDDAVKKATDDKAALEKTLPDKKKAVDEAKAKKEPIEKEVEAAKAIEAKAKEPKDANDKILATADADTKAATNKVATAKVALEKINADKKAKQKDKDTAAKALADAEKAVPDLAAKIKAATDAKANLDKALTDASAKLKEVTDKLTPLTKAFNDATAEVKKFTNAEEQLVLATTAAKKAADVTAAAKTALATAEEEQKKADADTLAAKKVATEAEKSVRGIAFSPDNRTVATVGDNQFVQTWSADTGAVFEVFRGHNGPVLSAAFTGAGKLASGGTDQTAIVWDLNPAWVLERTIGTGEAGSPLSGRVNALDFSPDGQLLATGSGEPSRSGQLKLWKVADGSQEREIKNAHSDTVQGMDFSADGKQLVSGAADKFVKVWNLTENKLIKAFEGHTHQVLGVGFKRDGRTVASAGADNAVKVWSLETGEGKRTIAGATKEVTSLCFVGATDQFVATSGDNNVRLLNEAGNNVRSFTGGTDFMYAAAAKPDGKIVIAGGQDGVLRIWNGTSGAALAAFTQPNADGTQAPLPPPPPVDPKAKAKTKKK